MIQTISSTVLPASCVINLSLITEVSPTKSVLNSIDLYDSSGLILQMQPEGVDDDDANTSFSRLTSLISLYIPETAKLTRILKFGILMKRGRLNPSFQCRWFVLSSDLKLNYYKLESGQHQGAIDLCSVSYVNRPQNSRDTSLTLQESERLWCLQAASEAERDSWFELLTEMVVSGPSL